jgi:LEA14-like dessication related protein
MAALIIYNTLSVKLPVIYEVNAAVGKINTLLTELVLTGIIYPPVSAIL